MKLTISILFVFFSSISVFSQDLFFEEISPIKKVDAIKIFKDANANEYMVTARGYGEPLGLYRFENGEWTYKLSSELFQWIEKISTLSMGQLSFISHPNVITIYNPALNLLRTLDPSFDIEASCMFEDKLYLFAENAFWVSNDFGITYDKVKSETEAYTAKDLFVNADGIYSTAYNNDQELFHFRKFDLDFNLLEENFEDQRKNTAADLRVDENVVFIAGINLLSTDSGTSFENFDSPGYLVEFENKSLFYSDNNEYFKLDLETKISELFSIPDGSVILTTNNDEDLYIKTPDGYFEILEYNASNRREIKTDEISDFALASLEINGHYIYAIGRNILYQYNLETKELKFFDQLNNAGQLFIDSDNRIHMNSLSDGILYRADEESFSFDTFVDAGYGYTTYIEKDSTYILHPFCTDAISDSQFSPDGGSNWTEFRLKSCIPYRPKYKRVGAEIFFYRNLYAYSKQPLAPVLRPLFTRFNLDDLSSQEINVPSSIPYEDGTIVLDKFNRFQINPIHKEDAIHGSFITTGLNTEFQSLPVGPNGFLHLGHDEVSTYVIKNDEGHPRFYFKPRAFEEYTELEISPAGLPPFEYFYTLDNGDFVAATSSGRIFYARAGSTSTQDELRTEINIFPNPAYSQLNIDTGDLNLEVVHIYTLTGQQLMSTNETTIDISRLNAGTYLIEVRYLGKESSIGKFVKVDR